MRALSTAAVLAALLLPCCSDDGAADADAQLADGGGDGPAGDGPAGDGPAGDGPGSDLDATPCVVGQQVGAPCGCSGQLVSDGWCCPFGPSATPCIPDKARYVRAGASGVQDGSSWAAAYDDLPATLERGATYFVAAGSYAGYDFDDPPAASALITIRKATALNHGADDGWQASYAEGQAVFGPLVLSSDHYLLDGGEPSGIKIVGGFQGLVVDAQGQQLTLRRCELDGNFTKSGGQHVDGSCNGINIHGSHVTLDRCDIHNIADDGVGVYGDHITIIGSAIHALHGCGTDGACGPCYNGHSDGLELQATSDVTLIGNIVYDIKSTAALITGQWSPGNYTENLTMINNIFYTPDTGLTVYLYYVKGAKVFNNVIWGRTQGPRYGGLALGPEVTDLELKNNIILNINFDHLGGAFDPLEHDIDYNQFAMIAASEYTANDHDQVGDPLFAQIPVSDQLADHKTSDLVAEDFALLAGSPAIDTGVDLAEVATDFAGTARPRDGDGDTQAAWDRGAFEH